MRPRMRKAFCLRMFMALAVLEQMPNTMWYRLRQHTVTRDNQPIPARASVNKQTPYMDGHTGSNRGRGRHRSSEKKFFQEVFIALLGEAR